METQSVLVVLASETPQVITESIYAYWSQYQITFDKVIVVTTEPYKKRLFDALTTGPKGHPGPIRALTDEYNLPPVNLALDNITVPVNETGEPIQDVCTPAEMVAFSDFVLELIFDLTAQPNTFVHASLAGGRRTMTFYLSFAMSVYARKHDTLSHVFAPPHLHNSSFYFPAKHRQHEDKVTLASIPFVRLRPSLPQKFIGEKLSFHDAEGIYQILNAPVSLEINYPERTIVCSGVTFAFSPANLAFYLVMVDDVLHANEGFDCPTNTCPDTTLALIYLNKRFELENMPHNYTCLDAAIESAENQVSVFKQNEIDGLKAGLKKSFFTSRKNQISQYLRSELPEVVAEHYDIDTKDVFIRKNATRPACYYGLNIEQRLIRVIR